MEELYIQRCFDLARLGFSNVSPNPLVGAVIVANNQIIGEGFHKRYGSPHAEVNAVNSILPKNKHLLSASTIYISLEPCCVFGNTPPCTNLILSHKIPRVVMSSLDLSPGVSGKSVEILKAAGIEVIENILASEGKKVSLPRATYVSKNRPYVILKYAKSKDNYIAKEDGEAVWISNLYSKRLTHKWRSEIDAIMVGTNTARMDNPSLTTRYYHGKSPVRVVLDRNLTLDKTLNIFNAQAKTIIFNQLKSEEKDNLVFAKINFNDEILVQILSFLHKEKVANLMIEGGRKLLQSFIDASLWDEARVLTGDITLQKGIPAPAFLGSPSQIISLGTDRVSIYENRPKIENPKLG